MAGIKEIRNKIKSVQNTSKITKAMEMVASSKMRKAQDRMRASRPYARKIRQLALHMKQVDLDYSHPFLEERKDIKKVGLVMVTTDKGLCGGLNTNMNRLVLSRLKTFEESGIEVQATAFGSKGLAFLTRLGVNVVSQETHLGDVPNLDRLVGALKVQLDAYMAGEIDAVYIATTDFINTMSQEPVFMRLLPLPDGLEDLFQTEDQQLQISTDIKHNWDYVFEPSAAAVMDALLHRYVESLVYQAVAENMASEQSARMVAMKAASDNAANVIDELQLVYNKTRQAAITKEISEIVGGAAAV